MEAESIAAGPDPDAELILVGFAAALRAAGLMITPDRTQAFVAAVALAGIDRRTTTYWSGRATLCASPEDLERYDQAFAHWFGPGDQPRFRRDEPPAARQPQATLTSEAGAGESGDPDVLAARASAAEVLRDRDVATLDQAERRSLADLFDRLVVTAPHRRALRRRPHHRGSVDLHRTLRRQLQTGGEVTRLSFRRRRTQPRRVVVLVDVSGSMAPYADALLRLGHRIVQTLPQRSEVFTLGTRLTRVTPALRLRQPDEAIAAAGRLVPDWSGGTRLGEVIAAFVGRWGRRGLARGAVVVVASDGWERGDPGLLGEQMRQLRLLAHAVIWMNPHRGKSGYAPVQSGIVASLPHLDELVAGHSLAAFAELLEVVADA